MPSAKVMQIQNALNCGELSPFALGRFDVDKYSNAVRRMENFLPLELGGAFFRMGLGYVAETKDSDARSRLIAFKFNTEQAYVLELGDLYMRFFANRSQVVFNQSVDPIDAETSMLIHADGTNGATAYTAETGQSLSFFGDAQLDTSQKKFGSSSIKFSGSGNISITDASETDFGTDDFAMDFWVKPNSIAADISFIDRGNALGFQLVWKQSTGKLQFFVGNALIKEETWTPTTGVWQHVAITRDGTDLHMFAAGTELGTATANSSNIAYVYELNFGSNDSGGQALNGWMDEIRISKGASRWTASFTPPTAQYGGAADWATSTAYVAGDFVEESGTVYICLVAHTSGTFATDLAAGKWSAQTELEVVTPYTLSALAGIQVAQTADTMYFFHADYPTYKLQRLSATSFTFVEAPFVRGPFLDTNITATTITPSSATGSTTLTASASIFESGHVGSLWRVKDAVVKITSFTSATVLVGTVQAEPSGAAGNTGTTSATADWAEGAFSAVRGYPPAGTFHGQRLVCGGTAYQPETVYATKIGAYENFKADASDESAAYTYKVPADEVNAIRWLASMPRALQAGTSGGTVSASVQAGTITNVNPPDINADTSYGVKAIQPKKLSSYLYYIQSNGFNLRELDYNYLKQRNTASDMNLLADHILRDGGGAVEMCVQSSPCDRVWTVLADGTIAVLVRNVDQQVMGWARVTAGEDSTSAGTFESVVSIPTDGGDDEVWVIVKRTVNGTTKRFIEYFLPERFVEDWDPVRLDCSLTLDNPIDMTAATKASPVVVTAPSHGLSNGDFVRIDNVEGMTDLNGNTYKIKNVTTNTLELTDTADANIDGTAYGTYTSGGQVRKKVTAITGLSHLEGEAVSVQADGLALTDTFTVSSGSITLATRAAVVHVGLPYDGMIKLLKAGDVNTQMRNRRFYLATLRLERSLGFKIGQDEDHLFEVTVGEGASYRVQANDGLFLSGDASDGFVSWWDDQTEVVIKQERANPLCILAIGLRSEVIEKD